MSAEVSGLAVIRRRECCDCGTPMFTDGRILCPADSEHIGEVEVEYVPASQLAGAVELLRELSEKWTDVRVSGNTARVTALGDAIRRAGKFIDATAER